jgi:hypothetical protein
MSEQVATVIKHFQFTEEDRTLIVLSDTAKIRLDGKLNAVVLKADADGKYPTTANINVRSALTNPKAVRKLVGFEATILHAKVAGVPITGAGFRLHDGTSQWYHNGSAWVISTSLWNTEAQVAANIATYNVKATRTFGVVVNLTTTDDTATPQLQELKVAAEYKIDFSEEIVYRTLVRALTENVRLLIDFALKVVFPGGSTINLSTARIDYSPDIVDVDSVFDHTADPDHLTNLLSSYDAPTKVITLGTAIPVGNVAWIILVARPRVAVENTSQDFIEVEHTPALVITEIESAESSTLPSGDSVVNKGAGTIIETPAPFRENLRFTMLGHAPGGVAGERLWSALVQYLESNPVLRSPGLDEGYRLLKMGERGSRTIPNAANLHTFQLRFQLMDIVMYTRKARGAADGVYPVMRVNFDTSSV